MQGFTPIGTVCEDIDEGGIRVKKLLGRNPLEREHFLTGILVQIPSIPTNHALLHVQEVLCKAVAHWGMFGPFSISLIQLALLSLSFDSTGLKLLCVY